VHADAVRQYYKITRKRQYIRIMPLFKLSAQKSLKCIPGHNSIKGLRPPRSWRCDV